MSNAAPHDDGSNGGLHVGVLGGGPWGLSLARAARRAGSLTTLYSRRHTDESVAAIRVTTKLEVLAEASILILAVPSKMARPIARDLGDHLNGAHLLVHGIRGLNGEGLMTISQILREETPVRRLGALGGPVQAEVADTPEALRRGLMYRETLPIGYGMWFVFPAKGRYPFWMKDTMIPLDMIFVSEDMRVVEIFARAPPGSTLPIKPKSQYRYVLEVPGGFARQRGIVVGSRVMTEPLGD